MKSPFDATLEWCNIGRRRKPAVRRTQIAVAVAIFSMLVLGVVAPPVSSLAGENCAAKLVGKGAIAIGFTCNVKFSNGSSMTECWTFAPGNLSQFFDIFTETLPVENELPEYGCACDATGSFKSPHYDSSPDAFECDDGNGTQLQGKLKGHKITGQSSDDQGNSAIFTCTPNTGCG
jgi:hypothetical protein